MTAPFWDTPLSNSPLVPITSGTVNISNPLHYLPGEFSRVPRPDFLDYADTPKPFVAPNGITWVSQGAYEQAIKLDEAQKHIKELERELAIEVGKQLGILAARLRFYDSDMYVWPAGSEEGEYLYFGTGLCNFCGHNVKILTIEADYNHMQVCRECLSKMFDAFDKKVTG